MSGTRKALAHGRRYCCFVPDMLDHAVVGGRKPYDPYIAFQWLVFEAAWKARTYRAGAAVVQLQRGQLAHSTRYMAKAWGWSEAGVRRFLTRLKTGAGTGAMIDAATDAGVTVISVRNYDRYQLGRADGDAAADAASDALSDAEATQQRRRKEESKTDKEMPSANAASPSGDPKTQLYRRGVEILGENSGGIVTDLLRAKGTVPSSRAALEAASEKANPREYIGAIIRNTKASAAGGLAYDPAL